jgi:alginate O-acetyltransferase complex protein AlgI
MPFNSPGFLLLLLPTVLLYYLWRTERWQHLILFLSSFAFYWFAGVRDLVVLLSTIAINFILSQWASPRRQVVAVVTNLAILAYYKYRFFLAALAGHPLEGLVRQGIPLGISFYIFQLIAYQIDLTHGRAAREGSPARLLLYVLFFPHHQAGPIMRPGVFLPQFRGTKPLDLSNISRGVGWIVYGLSLKVLADSISTVVTPLFASGPHTVVQAWTAALGFSMQIYGDFAGYSNMAVGLGTLFGYSLDRNFNQPYLACSPSAFWERWHITLSRWLRDYLYIPLGGNRHGTTRTYVNLLLTMALGGLWHGASWNFVVWGALHGVLLCVFRAFPLERVSRLLAAVVVQTAVVFLWVPFRAVTVHDTVGIWRAMCGVGVPVGNRRSVELLVLAAALFFAVHALEDLILGEPGRTRRATLVWGRVPAFVRGAAVAAVLVLATICLRDRTTFIYFRF